MKNLITSRLTAFLCAAVMVLGLTACGAKITGLSLPAGVVLEKGETLQMDLQYNTETQTDADALAEAAEKLELVWISDDETVAVVDENGLVTAVGAGETTVRVSAREGELSGSCLVTVVVTARDLVVPDTLELVTNGQNTANLNAAATPEDATDVTFIYTSSDESVATVDENGLVTAVANGEADITVTLTQAFPAATGETATAETARQPVTLTATTHVTVTTAAERIELDKTEGLLTVGSTHKIKAAVLPDTATYQTLTWTSSDEGVATVDENGKVTAKKAGSAVITASCGDVSAQYQLTVQNVKCSYCGKTGHTSSSCPTKAADEAAAAAAAQAAAEQAAQQQAATSGDSSTPSNDPPVGSSGFDDQYGSWFVTESHDWTQDPSNMSNGQAGVKGDWDAGFGMSSGTDWTENDAGSGGVVR